MAPPCDPAKALIDNVAKADATKIETILLMGELHSWEFAAATIDGTAIYNTQEHH